MKKYILIIVLVLAIFFRPGIALAGDNIAAKSATLQEVEIQKNSFQRVQYSQRVAIQNVLRRYNSTLVNYADEFVAAAYRYDLNPYLLVSISGLESFFGRYMIEGTYNGYGWGGGHISFQSWEEGIE